MTEDLVKSSSSQRSNPRVLRRVRPVPYECCGGACSFLNSGCFTLCCNGRNTRRRSSVYVPRVQKEVEVLPEDEGQGQLSETTKRLIKPYSQDALNEDDLYVLEREFDSECSDESTKKQNFVNSFDIDDVPTLRTESEEFLREEKVDLEDEISVLTDDTSASVGDGSAKKKKKKKKILNILKIGRTKRKTKDGVSVTSSAASLACSEISDGNVEDLRVASTILEKTELSQSANGEKGKIDEVLPAQTGMPKEKGSFLSRSLLTIFPSMRNKKDDVTISEAHSSPTLGSKSKSATPSPIAAKSRSGTLSSTNSEWQNPEEDIDRMIQSRGSLSGLGLRSDSMASVYSGAGEGRYGTVAVRGQVEFGLQYNYKAGALEIHVKQCKDLAPVDTKRNRSDPYVKVYLLPDKSKGGKRKTKVKKHTLNPVFDETLKFHISLNGLETRTLWLTVWHSDMFGRNDFLGEVMMALENKVFDDPAPVWYNLQERTEPFDDTISFKGDIIVCLKFVPPDMTVQKKGKRSRGTLHVLVKEAKYLTAYKANGTSDPFCKSYLLPDKGRNSKQKTPVVKKTVNPVWNHTFIYEDVTLQELAERCLELTVWDHDRLASNEFLGGVRFSLGTGKHYGKPVEWMDATGKELTLWKSMLERPNFWVEGCLSLRPSLDARTS